eukprot:Filipodium_phascolosomae@DN5272_c0_g1_i2.p1
MMNLKTNQQLFDALFDLQFPMTDGPKDCYSFSQLLFVLDDVEYIASTESRDNTTIYEKEKYVDAQSGETESPSETGNLPTCTETTKKKQLKKDILKTMLRKLLEQKQENDKKSKEQKDKSTTTN